MYVYIYIYIYMYIYIYIYISDGVLEELLQVLEGLDAVDHFGLSPPLGHLRVCVYTHTHTHTRVPYVYVYIYIYIHIERQREIHKLGSPFPVVTCEPSQFRNRRTKDNQNIQINVNNNKQTTKKYLK